MDLEEINRRVKEIEDNKQNNAAAHWDEDELYKDFISYIAKTGNNKQRKMAIAVLRTLEIDFRRWYG